MTILRTQDSTATVTVKTTVTRMVAVKETVVQVLSALALGTVAFFIAGILYLLVESLWI